MTTIINGSSPSITFSDSTTQTTSAFGTGSNLYTSGGNIGIGVSNPTQALVVNGQIYTGGASQQLGIYQDGSGMSIEAWQTGTTSTKKNMWLAAYGGQVGIGTNSPYASSALSVNGPIAQTASAGSYTIDTSSTGTTIGNGGTVSFSNFSGMIIVNAWVSGTSAIYMVGGGQISLIGSSAGGIGTVTYNSGISGYTWTNNTGSAQTMAFQAFRTRPGA
jgi:hypothetical protein